MCFTNWPLEIFIHIINVQDFLIATKPTRTESVACLQVMDAVADSKDTVMELFHNLREEFWVCTMKTLYSGGKW